MNIGTTIRMMRLEKGISQGELSRMIKISQTSLSQIENNIKSPSSITMKKLSQALKVPEVFFYFMSLDESDIPPEKKELYSVIYPSLQDMVRKLIV
ncbi:MAG TPA: helix-turn-helix transcriptional regulator [Bacteroidia bacterium]|nr:helix-turn-helix transcriptional regulator [Bacteroidia bacterium]